MTPIDPAAPGEPAAPAEPDDSPPAKTPGAAPDREGYDLARNARTNVVALGALDLLERHCGGCHANGASEGGLGDVADLRPLVAQGWIVPGSSATSPLFERILDGSMPPDDVRERLVSGEVAVIGRFIDELEAAKAIPCNALPFVSSDEAYARLAADIAQQPPADRPFIRYLGLTYASNAGLCGSALERQRLALFKQINSISTSPEIARPAPVDPRELLYRIDLRDYGWDREIDLLDDGSLLFADGWLAITANASPYAAEFAGLDADALKSATGTAVPFLAANAFVHFTARGDLYYALIGARKNIYETELELGLDVVESMEYGDLQLAGFWDAAPTRETLVYQATFGDARDRFFWSLQNLPTYGASSIFDDPFDIFGMNGQVIFHLPNGLQAYLANDANGDRLSELPSPCKLQDCAPPRFDSPASCHGCHVGGLLPVKDIIREYVEEHERDFDSATFASVLVSYPPAEEFTALQRQHDEIFLNALEQAGVPRGAPDPVSRVFLEFSEDRLDAARAAAELGVAAAPFASALAQMDPIFGALKSPEGTIDRAALTSAFHASQCALLASASNRPANCP